MKIGNSPRLLVSNKAARIQPCFSAMFRASQFLRLRLHGSYGVNPAIMTHLVGLLLTMRSSTSPAGSNVIGVQECAQEALLSLGLELKVNKSKIMSRANVLTVGHDTTFSEGSLVPQLAWEISVKYLNNPLSHFDCDTQFQDIADVMMEPIRSGVHSSSSETLATSFPHSYLAHLFGEHMVLVGSCTKYAYRMRTLQVTMFVLIPGLFIPDDFGRDAAMHLHMLRRRTALLLLMRWNTYEWCYIRIMRRWNYLGYLGMAPTSEVRLCAS